VDNATHSEYQENVDLDLMMSVVNVNVNVSEDTARNALKQNGGNIDATLNSLNAELESNMQIQNQYDDNEV
jgi:hypothetical protein